MFPKPTQPDAQFEPVTIQPPYQNQSFVVVPFDNITVTTFYPVSYTIYRNNVSIETGTFANVVGGARTTIGIGTKSYANYVQGDEFYIVYSSGGVTATSPTVTCSYVAFDGSFTSPVPTIDLFFAARDNGNNRYDFAVTYTAPTSAPYSSESITFFFDHRRTSESFGSNISSHSADLPTSGTSGYNEYTSPSPMSLSPDEVDIFMRVSIAGYTYDTAHEGYLPG